MRRLEKPDLSFEIDFCETILRHDGDNVEVLGMLAGFYTRVGRIDDGLALDQKLVGLEPENPTSYYNLACSFALKERKSEAVEALREALERGYEDFDWMMKDSDLKPLHAYPPFHELLRQFQIRK